MVYEEYCKQLHQCFDCEVSIKATTPPAYISDLQVNKGNDLIIFVCKKAEFIQNDDKKPGLIVNSIIEESLADLSITGQPLECPFENDNHEILDSTITLEPVVFPEGHYYTPVTLLEARKCISFVNLKLNPPVPVWILTNAVDEKRTFLLGCEIKSNWNTRMWALAHSNRTEKKTIKKLVEDFEKTFKVAVGYKRSSNVRCVFNIKDNPGMTQSSKCFLEVNWQQPSYEVPISQADTFLITECKVGQEECQVSRWWQQLMVMHKYLEIFKQRKQSSQSQMTFQRDTIQLPSFKSKEDKTLPLTTRVVELLKVSDSMSVCRQIITQQETSAFDATIQHLLKDNLHKGQDVIDRLWNLLIEAETYEELCECFQLVIREVRKNAIKPYIFAKNKTRLACLLRNIKSSSDVELMLEPLQLMVEMGLEKLKRDYIFIFMSSQLARVESLSVPKLPSFSEVESGDWQVTAEAHMQWLAQIHTVLELVSVVHSSLMPPTMLQVTSHALTTFVRPDDSPVPSLLHLISNPTCQLRVPIVTKEVCHFIQGDRMFHKWMLKLSADSDYIGFSSTYVFFEDSPFPAYISNQLQDNLNDTEKLIESLQTSDVDDCDSKLQENYSYVQLCTISNKLPN